jgi:hypothetical protein
MVHVTCDTYDMLVDTKETKDMDDDSLTSHEKELYSELMNESLVENESLAEAQSDSSSSRKCECEEHQNDLSKMIVKPWEEFLFNKNRHGLGYGKGNSFHILYYSEPVEFVSA